MDRRVAEIDFDTGGDLPRVRELLAVIASRASLPPSRIVDLVTAVNELAANSVRHGGGAGRVRLWRSMGELVCEVSDGGEGPASISPPAPGVHPAEARGIYIAAALCDGIRVVSAEGAGRAVQVSVRVPATSVPRRRRDD